MFCFLGRCPFMGSSHVLACLLVSPPHLANLLWSNCVTSRVTRTTEKSVEKEFGVVLLPLQCTSSHLPL